MKTFHQALLAGAVIALMTGCSSNDGGSSVNKGSTPLINNGGANDNGSSTNTGSTNTGSTNTGSTNTGSTNTGSTNTGSTNTTPTLPTPAPITLGSHNAKQSFVDDEDFSSFSVTLKVKGKDTTYHINESINFADLGLTKNALTDLGQARIQGADKEGSFSFNTKVYAHYSDHALILLNADPDNYATNSIVKANYSKVSDLAKLNDVTYNYKGKAYFPRATEMKQGDFNYQINFKGHNTTGSGKVTGLEFGNIDLLPTPLGESNNARAGFFGRTSNNNGYQLYVLGNGAEVAGELDIKQGKDNHEITLIGTKQ